MKLNQARISMRLNDAGDIEIDIRGSAANVEKTTYGSDNFVAEIGGTGYCDIDLEAKGVPGPRSEPPKRESEGVPPETEGTPQEH